MAKSSYLELCQRVRQECSIPGTMASVASQTGIFQRIVTWVADSDALIQSAFADWSFLWAQHSTPTIPNTDTYNAPSDLGAWDLDSFHLDSTTAQHTRLKYIDYAEYRDRYRNGVQTPNRPFRITVLPNNHLVVNPVPDDVYTLTADYYRIPTRLAANTDTSAIPERFEQAIIALARSKFAEEEGSPVMLNNALQEYGFWMEELKKHHLPNQMGRAQGQSSTDWVVRPE